MKAAFSGRFVHQYAALPEDRKVRFDKQLAFLLTNLRHPHPVQMEGSSFRRAM